MGESQHQQNDLAEYREDGANELGAETGEGEFQPAGADELITASSRKRVGSGTLILLLVVVLAAAGLFSMRSLARAMAGSIAGDKNVEETIDSWISGWSDAENGGAEVILPDLADDRQAGDVLLDDRTEKQVKLDNVQKNPFVNEFAKPVTPDGAPATPADPVNDEEVRLAQARDEMRVTCEKAATKLRLVMLMGGSRPMANISGRVVHVGDTIFDDRLGVTFTVVAIEAGSVTLEVADESIGFEFQTVLSLNPDQT